MPSDPLAPTTDEARPEPRYAGFWIRVVAHIIDGLLILAISLPVAYLLFGSAQPPAEPTPETMMADLVMAAAIAVIVILFWRLRGATPGKMLCGIRIVDAESLQPLSTGQCIGRYFAYIVSALPLLLGYFWVAVDRRKQGFHDKLAGSVVVREADLSDELSRLQV